MFPPNSTKAQYSNKEYYLDNEHLLAREFIDYITVKKKTNFLIGHIKILEYIILFRNLILLIDLIVKLMDKLDLKNILLIS